MIGDWKIHHWPRCTHHVFLSHCAENRDRLVRPVFQGLEQRQFLPWFDQHHYPAGRDAFEALREGIIHCRHIVYFVTAKFLNQGRGWNSIENAYANLMQQNLRFGSYDLCHIQLPLFFVPHQHVVLRRSAWGPLSHLGRFYPNGRVDAAAVNWAIDEIAHFIRREERRGASLAAQLQNDPLLQPRLKDEPNLIRRIMLADPPQIP